MRFSNFLRRVPVASTMILVTACAADDAFRPVAEPVVSSTLEAPSAVPDGERQAAADTSGGYMLVGPQGGNWVIGEHKINFPANSICDMSQTNYFDWGKPCTPISSTIRIDVKWWRDAQGHPHVDFQQALRFQPTRKGEVTLYLKDAEAARATNPKINYCPVVGALCVDESILDSSLATKRDSKGGFVYRIIRHFSGYNVWA
jgi:hypothetical protein